jgi:hypothetical protein
MKEYILCASNWYNDGEKHTHAPINVHRGFVVCGRRHHNCIDIFAMIVGFPYDDKGNRIHRTEVQGFLTNTNRFVSRKEALIIATEAKQLIHEVKLDSNVGLTSEDVW